MMFSHQRNGHVGAREGEADAPLGEAAADVTGLSAAERTKQKETRYDTQYEEY